MHGALRTHWAGRAHAALSLEKRPEVGVSSVILEYIDYVFIKVWYLHITSKHIFDKRKGIFKEPEKILKTIFLRNHSLKEIVRV